jgi:uncharacterized protein
VEHHIDTICSELALGRSQVEAVGKLLEEGGTVPFIARYRKESTGSLDEVAITAIRDRFETLGELDKRRLAILKSLDENGHLTDELRSAVESGGTLSALEDLYLPYRPKRRTRATAAREKGLEALAQMIYAQGDIDADAEAIAFVSAEKGVETVADAVDGACDIVAEWISEDSSVRDGVRRQFEKKGSVTSSVIPGKDEEGAKFRDYFDWEEPVSRTPSHRILAMRRGEKEGFLSLRIRPTEADALGLISRLVVKGRGTASELVQRSLTDAYKRLLAPSMETEIRLSTKKSADEEAIRIFSENLRQLLLAPPLGEKVVMGIDPGFRTGCKLVCLDRQGGLLKADTIFPNQGEGRDKEAREKIGTYCKSYGVEAISIGNGTGGRELETFIGKLGLGITTVMVNESGASIYSASEIAREEFPDEDLTVRGSISIGRRLMDPLAELVKIDPKAIGVGQYQHDVDQSALKAGLDDTVASCVNLVGVDVNTASKQLLTYVSGLGDQLASNIVTYRTENGPFSTRSELKKVPRLGAKAFEQAAGFLRIRGTKNPLDGSAVHPERYGLVKTMADDVGCSLGELVSGSSEVEKIDPQNYVSESVGLPTLRDILEELKKPGRDPREQFEAFSFSEGVDSIQDLEPGMVMPGIVTNITAFGAFVDVGVHQDGLVHISEMADKFVKDPTEVVKVHQQVKVRVLSVDLERKRIGLSMKEKSVRSPRS